MSKVSLAETTASVFRVPRPLADSILKILNGTSVGFGMRAGKLLRTHSRFLVQSKANPWGFHRSALLLYLHITQLMGADKRLPPNQVSVTLKTLAGWLGCSPRQAATHVQALTRSGVLPLLDVQVGKQGRPSRFTFVQNPFALDAAQQAQTVETRQRRHGRAIAAQAATMAAQGAGVLDADEATQRLRETQKRREWALITRRRLEVDEDIAGDAPALVPVMATPTFRRRKGPTPAEAFRASQARMAAATSH